MPVVHAADRQRAGDVHQPAVTFFDFIADTFPRDVRMVRILHDVAFLMPSKCIQGKENNNKCNGKKDSEFSHMVVFLCFGYYKFINNSSTPNYSAQKKSTAMPWIFSCCLRRYLTKTFSTWLPTLTM